jgi:hypothetical protein
MTRKRVRNREIDLSGVSTTEGLEVVTYDPLAPAPSSPPTDVLAGLPELPEAPYAEPSPDKTGMKGLWTAIEHL